MKKVVIEAKDLHKYYRVGNSIVRAVNGITLNIYKGDFIAIIGPSGSGKSTLLHLLGALDKPTKGTIKINGINTKNLDDLQLSLIRRKTIGFIFQTFNLITSLNALENVIVAEWPYTKDELSLRKKALDLLSYVGLKHRLYHKPNQLSIGQQQRVAIARALINDPSIILADEPTGNLDSKTGKKIIALLKKLNEEKNTTIVVVTHDKTLEKYAKKVLYIEDGKIKSVR